jgi:hypothetical protein
MRPCSAFHSARPRSTFSTRARMHACAGKLRVEGATGAVDTQREREKERERERDRERKRERERVYVYIHHAKKKPGNLLRACRLDKV